MLESAPPAQVAKLVDAPDLGSGAERCGGSSPFLGTIRQRQGFPGGRPFSLGVFFVCHGELVKHYLIRPGNLSAILPLLPITIMRRNFA